MIGSLSRVALVTMLTATSIAACGLDEKGSVAPLSGGVTIAGDGGSSQSTPSSPPTGTDPDASYASRCSVTPEKVSCTHTITKLDAGIVTRDVYWQTPSTPPPSAGYPVVVLYQGSFGGPSITWGELTPDTPFGGFHQGQLQAMLLDSGFTVIAPEAAIGVAWQTNAGLPWDTTTDKAVIDVLLTKIEQGSFGPANMTRLYATGISSGGYMTSRMAVSYAGKFRALAIQSGSYATCLGPVCTAPALPADHPPTLFLHGQLDTTVPLFTAELYHDALVDQGTVTDKIIDPNASHEWLAVAPEKITAWFMNH